MRTLTFTLAAVGLLLSRTPAAAQEDVSGQVKWTGQEAARPMIEQNTAYGDQIRRSLGAIKLPTGFKINLFAIAPDAYQMAVSPQGVAVFVGTRKSDVWVVTDRNKDRVADEVKSFAPAIDFRSPTGACFSADGFLYVVEHNRVRMFPAAEYTYESAGGPVADVVPQGKLLPSDQEAVDNTVCEVGPDHKLYISLGQPLNVPSPEKADFYRNWGIGGIIRMDRDGSNREVVAYGFGNSPGHDANGEHATNPSVLTYTGTMFPEKYRGIFSAHHARVMFTSKDDDGNTGKIEPFARGWHQLSNVGRLTDLAQLHDGSILVSDELAGAIYRISYGD